MSSTGGSAPVIMEKFVTSEDGTKIFAQAAGNSKFPSLVFIHGFALSTLVWDDIMKDANLLASFHVAAYDLRGHGRSGKPETMEEYSSLRYAQDFEAVIKAFEIASPPILVAWSLGGAVSADVTAHLGEDALAGIVYVSALPWLAAGATASTAWSASKGPSLMATDDVNLAVSARMEFTTNLFSHPEKVPAGVLWSWFGSAFLQDPAKMNLQLSRVQDTENLFRAGEEGMPVLVISGEASKDKYVNVDEVSKLVKEHFENVTECKVEDGSHAFFYEEKDRFVRELIAFAKHVFRV